MGKGYKWEDPTVLFATAMGFGEGKRVVYGIYSCYTAILSRIGTVHEEGSGR